MLRSRFQLTSAAAAAASSFVSLSPLCQSSMSMLAASCSNLVSMQCCSTSGQSDQTLPLSTHVRRSSSADGGAAAMVPGMVDVSEKRVTFREATAVGTLWLPKCVASQMMMAKTGATTQEHAQQQQSLTTARAEEFCTKKGPVFVTATIAATQAAKLTPQLIPFCHPLPITKCKIDWSFSVPDRSSSSSSSSSSSASALDDQIGLNVHVKALVGAEWVTGVEMEALTAASVALLTCYDMMKGIDGAVTGGMCIREVKLLAKSGGKLGDWKAK